MTRLGGPVMEIEVTRLGDEHRNEMVATWTRSSSHLHIFMYVLGFNCMLLRGHVNLCVSAIDMLHDL